MRVRWISLALLAVLAGCGGSNQQSGGAASCAAAVRWRSATYIGYRAGHRLPHGKPLGRAVIPACKDTNHSAADHDTSVAVRAIRGVDPRLAIVTDRDPRVLYVNGQELNATRARALLKRLRRHG